jgi:hypothetical protein
VKWEDTDIMRLVIDHYDRDGKHSKGCNHILSDTRTKYWIVRGREAIKTFQRNCPGCRLKWVKAATQIMAPVGCSIAGIHASWGRLRRPISYKTRARPSKGEAISLSVHMLGYPRGTLGNSLQHGNGLIPKCALTIL